MEIASGSSPRYRGRLSSDGSTGYPVVPGRYHLSAAWFSHWSHRVTLELAVNGLSDVVTVSYVDDSRSVRRPQLRGIPVLRDR